MLAFPKLRNGKTFREERADKRATKAAELARVHRFVDRRDGINCRACDKKCNPRCTSFTERMERHHIIPRSLGGEDTTANLARVCVPCHEARHKHGTLRISGNADQRDGTGRFSGLTVQRLVNDVWRTVKVG